MSKAQQLIDLLAEKYGSEPQHLKAKDIKDVAKAHGITTLHKVMLTRMDSTTTWCQRRTSCLSPSATSSTSRTS
jgi:hypothetical protein